MTGIRKQKQKKHILSGATRGATRTRWLESVHSGIRVLLWHFDGGGKVEPNNCPIKFVVWESSMFFRTGIGSEVFTDSR